MSKLKGSIVSGDESEIHDEPHVADRRIRVTFIQSRVEEVGLEPRTVVDPHDVDVAEVYEALAYYHNNPDEVEAAERARRQTIERHEGDDLMGPGDV